MSNEVSVKIAAPETQQKFVELFSSVHKVSTQEADSLYKVEKFHFLSSMEEKGLMEKVTDASAMGVFLDVVANGLSFSPQSKQVYIMSRSVKTNRKNDQGKDIYEDRLYFQTQPDGKIFQAQKAGSIHHVTKPVIVYSGDEFEAGAKEDGTQYLIHKAKIPRESQVIIAAYVFVKFSDGSREPTWLTMDDIFRLKEYSEKQNGRWDASLKKRVPGKANDLYSSGPNGQIDAGFLGAKVINAAMKNVRKAGTTSQHEVMDDVEVVDTPTVVLPMNETEPITSTLAF